MSAALFLVFSNNCLHCTQSRRLIKVPAATGNNIYRRYFFFYTSTGELNPEWVRMNSEICNCCRCNTNIWSNPTCWCFTLIGSCSGRWNRGHRSIVCSFAEQHSSARSAQHLDLDWEDLQWRFDFMSHITRYTDDTVLLFFFFPHSRSAMFTNSTLPCNGKKHEDKISLWWRSIVYNLLTLHHGHKRHMVKSKNNQRRWHSLHRKTSAPLILHNIFRSISQKLIIFSTHRPWY